MLWRLFVPARMRLSKNLSYDGLHLHAHYNKLVRQVMGVERLPGFEEITFACRTIVDNVSLLDDKTVKEINDVIVSFCAGMTRRDNLKCGFFTACVYQRMRQTSTAPQA